MENTYRDARLRALVGVLGLAVVVAAIWATAALAGGAPTNASNSVTNQEPGAAFTQEGGSGPEGCRDHDGQGEGSDDAADV